MSLCFRPIVLIAAVLMLRLGGALALAHQPGLSTVFVDLGTNRLNAQFTLAWAEMDAVLPLDANRDRVLAPEELDAARPQLLRLAETALSFESDGRMLSLKAPPTVQIDDTTGLRFQLVFELPPTRVLLLTSEIVAELSSGHSQIVTVHDAAGVKLGETVLDRKKPTVEIPLFNAGGGHQPVTATRDFLMLGVHHILTGWDHLAFLFGLLIVGGKVRDAVKIITSFTVAHSLTLALATFHVINLSPGIVEPIIAASIVYVGFENILRDDFRRRWMLTFALGLIHGCGFASVLRGMGLGTHGTSVTLPLICFNAGVELGQVAIAALALPLIWKLKQVFPKRWVPVTSVALIILGSYFFVQRVWM